MIEATRDGLTSFALAGIRDGGHEGMAFWAGYEAGDATVILQAIVPNAAHSNQKIMASAAAVGDAARAARHHGLGILCQVHWHPGDDARHSDGDDELVLLPFEGMLSIVVPNFGLQFDGLDIACIHQFQSGRWVLCSAGDQFGLIPLSFHPGSISVSDCSQFYRQRNLRTQEYMGNERFDALPVHVAMSATTLALPAGQLGLLALANQLARVHRRISFSLPSSSAPLCIPYLFPRSTVAETLLTLVRSIDPCGDFTFGTQTGPRASIGLGADLREQFDWYIGADRALGSLSLSPRAFSAFSGTLLGAAVASYSIRGQPLFFEPWWALSRALARFLVGITGKVNTPTLDRAKSRRSMWVGF